jgi:molybdopterin synthase catalytic subunit
LIEIIQQDFDINEVVGKLNREGVGAIVTFIGTVRDFTELTDEKGEKKRVDVQNLVYESYDDMAVQKISEIRDYALENYGINEMAVIHRKGTLKPSENIVIIAVSAAHRKAAFSACEYAISELKKIVPIWKKEVGIHGEYWVGEEKEEGTK